MNDLVDQDIDLFSEVAEKRFINFTPLIDMMFQLVTFLMLTTNFNLSNIVDINVAYSEAGEGEVKPQSEETKTIMLKIESAAKIIINDKEYDAVSMVEEVKKNPGDNVALAAGDNANIQDMVAVMDKLNVAGITNLTFSQ